MTTKLQQSGFVYTVAAPGVGRSLPDDSVDTRGNGDTTGMCAVCLFAYQHMSKTSLSRHVVIANLACIGKRNNALSGIQSACSQMQCDRMAYSQTKPVMREGAACAFSAMQNTCS